MYAGVPFAEIAVQPKERVRFRYESERSCAAIIFGETSNSHQKTYPSIRILNYHGKAMVVVSCVSAREPYTPHPHKLFGETRGFTFRNGACCFEVISTPDDDIQLHGVGIQRTKRDLIMRSLEERRTARIDPFRTNSAMSEKGFDLHTLRLCFQVFLPDPQGRYRTPLTPVLSRVIQDKKFINDLVILRTSRSSGSRRGGDEVFLLCNTVTKEDIRVRFYEESLGGDLVWEDFGSFATTDVYHGNAIVFKTPSYPFHLTDASQCKTVSIQLFRPSTKESSNPVPFTYRHHHEDPDWIEERRGRKRLKVLPDDLPGAKAAIDDARLVPISGDRNSSVTLAPSTAGLALPVCLPAVLNDVHPQSSMQTAADLRMPHDNLRNFPQSSPIVITSELFDSQLFGRLPASSTSTEIALHGPLQHQQDETFCGDIPQADIRTPASRLPSSIHHPSTGAITEPVLRVDYAAAGSATAAAGDTTATAQLQASGQVLSDTSETWSFKSLGSLLDSLHNIGHS